MKYKPESKHDLVYSCDQGLYGLALTPAQFREIEERNDCGYEYKEDHRQKRRQRRDKVSMLPSRQPQGRQTSLLSRRKALL